MNQPEHIERLRTVYYQRILVAEDDAERRAIKDAFEAEHAPKWENMKLHRDILGCLESEAKAEALKLHSIVPNMGKTDLPGITIKEVKVFHGYTLDSAIAWCVDHKNTIALKLDEAAYKKLIEFGGAPGTITPSFRADLATDLGPVLEANMEVTP